jgi:hypothetical protein
MTSEPASAATASDLSRPWVSEISPRRVVILRLTATLHPARRKNRLYRQDMDSLDHQLDLIADIEIESSTDSVVMTDAIRAGIVTSNFTSDITSPP